MMRPETWRMLLVVAMYRDWDVRQWDAAYLQADLDPKHKVYIEDTNEKGEVKYWLVHKALYGLKQSSHEWYRKLREILDSPECGLTQCVGDEGTYHGYNGLLGSHVDDLLVVGTQGRLDEIEQIIEKQFELDKRGKPEKMLGIELTWNDNSDEVLLTQKGLIETLAKQYGIVGVRRATNPPAANMEGALHLLKTSKFQRRSRHIEHWFHYLRQESNKGHLAIHHIPRKKNPSDILTKIIPMSTIHEWKKNWIGGTTVARMDK
jgi:hypothetical protein